MTGPVNNQAAIQANSHWMRYPFQVLHDQPVSRPALLKFLCRKVYPISRKFPQKFPQKKILSSLRLVLPESVVW
jgi:hypothetical protein